MFDIDDDCYSSAPEAGAQAGGIFRQKRSARKPLPLFGHRCYNFSALFHRRFERSVALEFALFCADGDIGACNNNNDDSQPVVHLHRI